MPVTISDFESLDPTTVAEIETFLVDFIKTAEPNLDLSPNSVLFQFVVRLAAQYHGLNQQNINRVLSATSLKTAIADPTIADEAALDNLASNYLVTRRQGTPAAGQIRIILNSNRLTSIPRSTVFTANGINFSPTQAFSGVRSTSEILSASERLITPFGQNQFSFVVDVVAVDVGAAGNVPANTVFTISSSQGQVVSAVAVSDFDGGTDTESNTQLMERLAPGISTKNLGSRTAARALIQAQFPGVSDISIIGAGDPEMVRSRLNAFGVDTFGCADIYVRSRSSPITMSYTKLATYDSGTDLWTMTFTRDGADPSGIYEVLSIYPENRPDLRSIVSSVHRGYDLSPVPGVDVSPRMDSTAQYGGALAFSRYQVLTVHFSEDYKDDMVNNQQRFVVEVNYLPQLAEINDFVLSRSVRHLSGDYVVRAPIPCFVGIELNIVKGPGDPDPDVDAIKLAIMSTVHAVDFKSGVLSADSIIAAVRSLLPERTRVVTPIGMRGKVVLPWKDSTAQESWLDSTGWLFNNHELKLSSSPYTKELSSRTSCFFISPENISVNILPSDHVSV